MAKGSKKLKGFTDAIERVRQEVLEVGTEIDEYRERTSGSAHHTAALEAASKSMDKAAVVLELGTLSVLAAKGAASEATITEQTTLKGAGEGGEDK